MTTSTQNYSPFIESNIQDAAASLRARMKEKGYLFFRDLVPSEEVLHVRREALELCAAAGWLDPSRDVMDGIAAPGQEPLREGMPEYMTVYRKILQTTSFHDFPISPSLKKATSIILDTKEPLTHPRRIGRVTFPNMLSATTPAHQDFHYIRGATETYSCWTPLGECPIELGGLAVWPGSHRRGFVEHTVSSPGVGGAGIAYEEENAQWHISDFGLGDALFFHSHTVHKAMPNLTRDRLRVSTDNRYQRAKDEIAPGSLKPHYAHSAAV